MRRYPGCTLIAGIFGTSFSEPGLQPELAMAIVLEPKQVVAKVRKRKRTSP